jgi:hypothetical protein
MGVYAESPTIAENARMVVREKDTIKKKIRRSNG